MCLEGDAREKGEDRLRWFFAMLSPPRFAAFELQIPECLHVVVGASVPGGDTRGGTKPEEEEKKSVGG